MHCKRRSVSVGWREAHFVSALRPASWSTHPLDLGIKTPVTLESTEFYHLLAFPPHTWSSARHDSRLVSSGSSCMPPSVLRVASFSSCGSKQSLLCPPVGLAAGTTAGAQREQSPAEQRLKAAMHSRARLGNRVCLSRSCLPWPAVVVRPCLRPTAPPQRRRLDRRCRSAAAATEGRRSGSPALYRLIHVRSGGRWCVRRAVQLARQGLGLPRCPLGLTSGV